MAECTVALIGTGPNPEERQGPPMAYHHARAYGSIDRCELVACADIVPENAEAFADEFAIAGDRVYTDHLRMLDEVEPDLMSVCVPPVAHAELVIDCARSGVGAIHSEKPMALTWKGAREMAEACEEQGTKLTFNHQRRFSTPWRRAKELLDDGEIGALERVEMSAPNLFDWGTHCFDLCGMFVDEADPEWVIGQVDYREERIVYGAHQENQGIATWEYADGTFGLASTGEGSDVIGCFHRLVGADGTIEVRVKDGPALRVRSAGDSEWRVVDCENTPFYDAVEHAIRDVVRATFEEGESELRAENALRATELIFGTWESSRRRGRVDFPLEIEDNPLESMVESGDLQPSSFDDS